MTAAEADARFDALVSDYRRDKGRKKGRDGGRRVGSGAVGASGEPATGAPATPRDAADATNGTLVVVIVFCLGVTGGAVWPHRPLATLLIGIPMILVGRAVIRRWRRDGADG